MQVILIAAMTRARVIGKDGELPWPRIPADAMHFYRTTKGHPVVYGRTTWEKDLKRKPLLSRPNIILSSTYKSRKDIGLKDSEIANYSKTNPELFDLRVASNVQDALRKAESFYDDVAEEEKLVYIAGGAKVYESFLPYATGIILSLIYKEYEGDAFFPRFSLGSFPQASTSYEIHSPEGDIPGFTIVSYKLK